MTKEEQLYSQISAHDDDSGALETAPAGEQVVDQPQLPHPRMKLVVKCRACGKSAKVVLREGSHTENGAQHIARFYERQKCGNCGVQRIEVKEPRPYGEAQGYVCALVVEVRLAPRNWLQRLLRMK